MWSQNLWKNKSQPDESWKVSGDAMSLERAEAFELQKDIIDSIKKTAGTKTEEMVFSQKSVFHFSEENDFSDAEHGINLFGGWSSKTQGYPYHLAIVAVCIVLETHLDGKGYTSGDFTRSQSVEMCEWLEETFGKSYLMPVVFDAERLWKYLREANNEQTALFRFLSMCKLSTEEKYRFLEGAVGRTALFETLADKLNTYYSSLSQYGAMDIWEPILAVWQDVDVLLDFIDICNKKRVAEQDEKERKPLDLTELLERLCKEYVIFNPYAKEKLDILHRKSGDLETVSDQTSDAMILMMGVRRTKIELYIPKDEMWEAFMARDPKNAATYKDILDKAEKEKGDELEKINKLIAETEEKLTRAIEENDEPDEADEDDIKLLNYPEKDRYIVRQCLLQAPKFKDLKGSLTEMGKEMQKASEKYADIVMLDTPEEYKKLTYKYAKKNGVVLTERIWLKIDELKDLELLRLFLTLAALDSDEKNFCDWRRYAFEYDEYWEVLKGE